MLVCVCLRSLHLASQLSAVQHDLLLRPALKEISLVALLIRSERRETLDVRR